jgi:hypothetical protein
MPWKKGNYLFRHNFLLEAKGPEFQSQFITISELELQSKVVVSSPQKYLMKKTKEEILRCTKRGLILAAAVFSPPPAGLPGENFCARTETPTHKS